MKIYQKIFLIILIFNLFILFLSNNIFASYTTNIIDISDSNRKIILSDFIVENYSHILILQHNNKSSFVLFFSNSPVLFKDGIFDDFKTTDESDFFSITSNFENYDIDFSFITSIDENITIHSGGATFSNLNIIYSNYDVYDFSNNLVFSSLGNLTNEENSSISNEIVENTVNNEIIENIVDNEIIENIVDNEIVENNVNNETVENIINNEIENNVIDEISLTTIHEDLSFICCFIIFFVLVVLLYFSYKFFDMFFKF